MKPLIQTPYEVRRYQREATSWIGTPFVIRSAVKNHGVDCVRLVSSVLVAVGHGADYSTLPPYVAREGHSAAESKLLRWIESAGVWFQRVENGTPEWETWLPGDVVAMRIGAVAHHAMLVFEGSRFIHSAEGRKVEFGSAADRTYRSRIVAVFRPMAQS